MCSGVTVECAQLTIAATRCSNDDVWAYFYYYIDPVLMFCGERGTLNKLDTNTHVECDAKSAQQFDFRRKVVRSRPFTPRITDITHASTRRRCKERINICTLIEPIECIQKQRSSHLYKSVRKNCNFHPTSTELNANKCKNTLTYLRWGITMELECNWTGWRSALRLGCRGSKKHGKSHKNLHTLNALRMCHVRHCELDRRQWFKRN